MSKFLKLIKVVKERPLQLIALSRQTFLFYQCAFWRVLIPLSQKITLGQNVRIQKRRSLQCNGEKSEIIIGENSVIYENAKIETYGEGKLSIGEYSIIGDAKIYCRSSIHIGNHFLTSWNVFIQDFDPHPINGELRKVQIENMSAGLMPNFNKEIKVQNLDWDFQTDSIVIGHNVWVGANVSILKGVNIGDNCIIATGSVVTKGVYPKDSILAGVPAKVVKTLN